MGKITTGLNTMTLATGNTVATPFRRGGEIVHALANIPRQGCSSVKNIAEVNKQTWDALVDNFLNFSKVQGKWYQKMIKVPVNLASACTRRPAMILGAGMASTFNQGLRKPFKKLLYTPGKMFTGIGNATRIFSTKKGFDFAQYDTHETDKSTRVQKIKDKSFGFFGVKGGSAIEKPAVPQSSNEKKTSGENSWTEKPDNNWVNPPENNWTKKSKPESKSETPASTSSDTPPKTIDDIKQKDKDVAEKKDKADQEKRFPQWSTLDDTFKAQYKKEYDNILKNNLTEEGIVARGKEAKMGDSPEEILKNFKEKDPTFVGYMEEILAKAA